MNNPNKSSASEYIHLAGLILLSLCLFIGILYWQNGSFQLTIPATLIFFGAFYGVVFILVKLKNAKKNPSQMKKWEYLVFILGYGALALGSMIFFSHFMDYQFNRKAEVSKSGMAKMEAIETLFENYETHVNDKTKLYGTIIKNHKKNKTRKGRKEAELFYEANNLGKSVFTGNLEEDINNLKGDFKLKLRQGFGEWKESARRFVASGRAAFGGVNPVKLPSIYQDADANYLKWSGMMVENSSSLPFGEKNPFLPQSISTDDNIQFTKLDSSKIFNPFTLIAFLILNTMILWPYLFASRSDMADADGGSGEKLGGEL